MRKPARFAAVCFAVAVTAHGPVDAQNPLPGGLLGTRPVYGYDPLKPHYGPIQAQRELECLTYQPGIRGLDHGYGLGCLIGFGPQARSAGDSSAPVTTERGFLDARWSSGYVSAGDRNHDCGHFSVLRGCNCLTPSQYQDFALAIVPTLGEQNVGDSWYLGMPASTADFTEGSGNLPLPMLDPE